MTVTKITPWNFGNDDKGNCSPDGFHRLFFYNLNEVAMGAPLRGECYLECKDNVKIKIHDSCGGPPVWETTGRLVAIPIWMTQMDQRVGVVDVIKKELTIFQKSFSVLQLRSFHNGVIYADLPATFDTRKEKIDDVIKM